VTTRTVVAWVAIVLGAVLVISSALGFGEARLLAQRGVEMMTVEAEDGSRWVLAGERMVPAREDTATVVADPTNPALNAGSALAHARTAGFTLLAGLMLASVGSAIGLGTRRRTVQGAGPAPAERHLRLVAST
jgi:hypothetical protein